MSLSNLSNTSNNDTNSTLTTTTSSDQHNSINMIIKKLGIYFLLNKSLLNKKKIKLFMTQKVMI